ncbi:hypothetical protein Hte_011740 [Hypoxylon texense]
MDLRAMLNGPDGGASKKQPSQPSLQPPSASSTTPTLAAAPSTPSHALPPQSFRDYSHSAHASPIPNAHEYPPNHPSHPNHTPASAGPGPYPSPTSYNPPANAFTGRPPVPPLQPPSAHDIRSPGSASISGPSPGYRRTPTSSISNASGGYPFPTQQPPVSPVQRHQYGPQSAGPGAGPGVGPSVGPYPRDSYNPQPQQHSSVQYAHGQQQSQPPLPQTPPVVTPGGSHPYLHHQRSHSIQSTPTPTSAHSQPGSYGAPYVQGSPVATHHPPPPLEQQHQLQQQHQHHQRQSSQPPTPLGQPMPGPLRQSPAASYQQPPSPYQKRISTAAANSYPPQSQPVQSPPPPPPPPSASIQRLSTSSSRGAYDAVAESHRGSQSRSNRERSLSVSPKTRVPSLPSNGGGHRPPSTSSDSNPYNSQHLPTAPTNNNTMKSQAPVASTKRKLEQRDLGSDELENDRKPPPPPQMNGNHAVPALPGGTAARPSSLAVAPHRKRVKYEHPPAWAQSTRARPPAKTRNFSLKHYIRQHGNPGGLVNGSNQHDPSATVKVEHTSRHPSPEATRSAGAVKAEEPAHANVKDSLVFNNQPFPWEPSISNETPMNIVSREVADFLALSVLQFPHFGEVQSVGAQFEIEAKLGTIIDKMTNDRLYFPGVRAGECVLDSGRVAFRSSMTEGQHQRLNGYLNEQVKASFPQNPMAMSRVQVHYVHRREIDRFYELPAQMRQRIPPGISSLIQGSTVKARITYDQKTGNVLAKIVKARVADMNIHFPHLPLDCRISINIEMDWDGTVEEIERCQIPNKERPPDRIKDRLSYKHGFYQIDLTQVTQGQPTSGGQPPQVHPAFPKEHELEVELEARHLIEHGRMLMRNEPNRYEDLVDGLVNNMRLLARRCLPAS